LSVEELDVVDFISISAGGRCVLTVSDHLDWQPGSNHQIKLQDKLNKYIAFLESGEVYQRFADAKGREFVIRVAFLHPPDEVGLSFLLLVRDGIRAAGFDFEYSVMSTAVN
jgi:hypothetical protein